MNDAGISMHQPKAQKASQGRNARWNRIRPKRSGYDITFWACRLPLLLVVFAGELPHGTLLERGLVLVHSRVSRRLEPSRRPGQVFPLPLLHGMSLSVAGVCASLPVSGWQLSSVCPQNCCFSKASIEVAACSKAGTNPGHLPFQIYILDLECPWE